VTQPPREAPRSATPESEGPTAVGFLALVLAWLVPGLGHFLIGQKSRGLVFALTIHLLFAFGMLIGGIRAINPPEQAIWTYTQMLTGWPMLIANRVEHYAASVQPHIEDAYRRERPPPEDDSRRQERMDHAREWFAKYPTLTYHPKVQDIGAVYCGIAGMLNLLVMFDVLLRITGSTRELAAGKRAAFDSGPPNTPPAPPARPRPSNGGAA
jgi:hypothetical protein